MNLRNVVIKKIEELGGPKNAAEFFGKREQTLKTWLKNAPIPMDAVQKVLDDELGVDTPMQPAPPELKTARELNEAPAEASSLQDRRLENLNNRVSQLEGIIFGPQEAEQPRSGYGFRTSPPIATVLPAEAPRMSQVNTAVPPPPAQPTVGQTTPVTPGNGPYLPRANNWCQPWPQSPSAGRV